MTDTNEEARHHQSFESQVLKHLERIAVALERIAGAFVGPQTADVEALTQKLKTSDDALAAAVIANTPKVP